MIEKGDRRWETELGVVIFVHVYKYYLYSDMIPSCMWFLCVLY